MISLRGLYLSQVGQTSDLPLLLEIDRAEGVYIYDIHGKRYFDMNSGIAVSSLGHCHPKVIKAIRKQTERYMHTMVYGEHIQAPQVVFAQRLLAQLADNFESIYYLMSGTEATELALKIAKKYTGRYEIVVCRNAYHGSSHGAESLRSDVNYKQSYLPLLPGIKHIDFNNEDDFTDISCRTACVICEAIQGEAGVIGPKNEYLKKLRIRCSEVGALLIIDEIQTGFGRTGSLFAHQKFKINPDLLLIGKAMGGGMPLSGVIGSRKIMESIVRNPALGHITTFGGHPVSCAAADAALEILLSGNIISEVKEKEKFILQKLTTHPIVKEVRSQGLMMAVEITKRKYLKHAVSKAFELGVLVDWFLFNNRSFRLAPPLIISKSELDRACDLLLEALDYAKAQYN